MNAEASAANGTKGYDPPRLTAARAIRACRQAQGLSARSLSLGAGLSPSYVSKLEAGAIDPGLWAVARIMRYLGLNAGEIYVLMAQEASRAVKERG